MSIHVEVEVESLNPQGNLEEIFDVIADAYYECGGIENQDVSADLDRKTLTFAMDLMNADHLEAIQRALVCVRTALHASGGSTPNWPADFEIVRQHTERNNERQLVSH